MLRRRLLTLPRWALFLISLAVVGALVAVVVKRVAIGAWLAALLLVLYLFMPWWLKVCLVFLGLLVMARILLHELTVLVKAVKSFVAQLRTQWLEFLRACGW